MQTNSSSVFHPKDIVFKDDARHRTGFFSHVETWYYDAIFENGYSIVSLVNVIHIGKIGSVLSGLFFYKDGNLLNSIRERFPLRQFYGSEDTILLKLKNKEILKGIIELNGDWKYLIKRGNEKYGLNLEFVKTMKPFKGKTYLGKWLAIPGFSVSGELTINGKILQVIGNGYHDHNIYPIKAPFVTKGYFFGKIHLENANVIWAQVQKKKSDLQSLVILAKNDSYTCIDPDKILFTIKEKRRDHRKVMPHSCHLQVDDSRLKLDVKFFPNSYHYIRIPATKYWRYHMRYNGSYKMGSTEKSFSEIDIAEFLSFF
jgi:hypothetical protein